MTFAELETAIVGLLGLIPKEVGAAIIAATVAMFGVWLGNRNSLKVLREQLQADSRERAREREFAIKREIYLPAAASVSKLQAMLAQFINPDTFNDSEFSRESAEHLAVVAKIHVVGSNDTVAAIVDLMQEFSAVILELSLKRLEAVITQSNEASAQEDAALRISLLRACLSASERVSQKMFPAVFTIREELGLPLNQEAYREFVERGMRKNRAEIEEFIDKLELKIAESE